MLIPRSFANDFGGNLRFLHAASGLGWPVQDLQIASRGRCATTSRYQRNSKDDTSTPTYAQYIGALEGEPQCRALESVEVMREANMRITSEDYQHGVYADGALRLTDPLAVHYPGDTQFDAVSTIADNVLNLTWGELGGNDGAYDDCRCGKREPVDPECRTGLAGETYSYDGLAKTCELDEGQCPPRFAWNGAACVPIGTKANCTAPGDGCPGLQLCVQEAGPGFPFGCRCPAGMELNAGTCVASEEVSGPESCASGLEYYPASGGRPARCVPLDAFSDCGGAGITCDSTQVCDEFAGPLGCRCPPGLPIFATPDGESEGICTALPPEPLCPPAYRLDPAPEAGMPARCIADPSSECCEGEWREPGTGVCCDDAWLASELTCDGEPPVDPTDPDGCQTLQEGCVPAAGLHKNECTDGSFSGQGNYRSGSDCSQTIAFYDSVGCTVTHSDSNPRPNHKWDTVTATCP